MNTKKEQLIARVQKAKRFLRHHNGKDAKNVFCDSVYGTMYKAESNRIDNLWACKTTDEDFTNKLENFAKNPTKQVGHTAEFTRFMAFVSWYTRLGGRNLTDEDIEKAYPKFQ